MTTIMNKLDWITYPQLIIHESIKLLHRVSYEEQPKAINDLLYHNLERSDINRLIRKPSVKHKAISAKTTNSFLHRVPISHGSNRVNTAGTERGCII